MILAVLTFVVMPLITIVMGLVLGVLLLLGRMVGIATWRVRAVGGERTFEWRARGFLRGRRAIHGVARARERGGEAAVPGGAQAD